MDLTIPIAELGNLSYMVTQRSVSSKTDIETWHFDDDFLSVCVNHWIVIFVK